MANLVRRDRLAHRWPHIRRGLAFVGAAVTVLVLVILLRQGGLPGQESGSRTPAPPAGATDLPTPERTRVFDRGGPNGGALLGSLAFDGGTPDGDIGARLFIDHQIEPRLVRMCKAGWLPPPPAGQDCVEHMHTAGYRVTSSLDFTLTANATSLLQEALRAGLAADCGCHTGAIVTIDPRTGEVLVYLPGPNQTQVEDTRARADIDQLTETNTPGTAFMPVTFLAWFDKLGKAPMSSLWDTNPLQIPGLGTITNPRADNASEGLISARTALGAMQEVPAFRAADEVGIDAVLIMAAKLGITTLASNFDPNWFNHAAVDYAPNLGSAGVNIRAIDMAFLNATLANMGVMVGTPSLASNLDLGSLKSRATAQDQEWDEAARQSLLFQRGDLRLPGTRELDPIVVLEVADRNGKLLFVQGEPERRQVVNAGSVWLLHSIMSDCTARLIIWPCGRDNLDLALDFSMSDGQRPPAGVQFGRMPFPPDPTSALEVWMTGYTRYGATVAWVGNANNEMVNERSYAASNTVVRLWKAWMGSYHDSLQRLGRFTIAAGFDDLQPANVVLGPFHTTSTDRDLRTGDSNHSMLCKQVVRGWFRTDVEYASECESLEVDTRDGLLASAATPPQFKTKRDFRILPNLLPESARSLAQRLGISVAPIR